MDVLCLVWVGCLFNGSKTPAPPPPPEGRGGGGGVGVPAPRGRVGFEGWGLSCRRGLRAGAFWGVMRFLIRKRFLLREGNRCLRV